MNEPTIDECFAAGKGPEQSVPYSEGGLSNTPEERARFEAYMRGHCWEIGNYDESLKAYDTVLVRMLYGVWRDRGALCESKLKRLDAQPVPVEPDGFPPVPAAFINVIAEEGSKQDAIKYLAQTWNERCAYRKYAKTLQSALQRAHTERENWQETARQYAGNSDYWRERAEKAEAKLADEKVAAKRLSALFNETDCKRIEAEQANRRMVELMKEPSDDALQRAGAVVGPMNGYEGESPDADRFEWFKAMSAELLKEVE